MNFHELADPSVVLTVEYSSPKEAQRILRRIRRQITQFRLKKHDWFLFVRNDPKNNRVLIWREL